MYITILNTGNDFFWVFKSMLTVCQHFGKKSKAP